MKKFLAFLCLVVIVLIFPITLLGTVAKYRLFTAPAIKQIVRTSRVAEYLPELIATAMTSAGGTAEADLTALDSAAAEELVTTALPPEDVYVITDQTIDAVGTWFTTDKPIEQLDLKIDLSKLKQNLAPAIGERLNVYLKDLPTCDANTTPTSFSSIDSINAETMTEVDCLPVNFDISTMFNGNDQIVGDVVMQNVPDQLTTDTIITEQLKDSNISIQSLNNTANQLRTSWRWLNIGIWIGWGVIGMSLLMMVLLRLRPAYAAFNWLGWTHFFLTLELIPVSLFLWFSPKFILPWLSTSINLTGLTIVNTALTKAMQLLTWPIIWTMVGTAVATVIFFILRLIIKHSSQPNAQTPAVATPPATTGAQPPPQ